MCSTSPGITQERKNASHLSVNALRDDTNIAALHAFHQLVLSSLSSGGRLKVIHNDVGGHVTLTSCSGRLLSSLSASNPIIKLLVAAIQGHIRSHSDGGLFTAAFTLSLITSSLKSDIPPRLLADIYEYLLDESLACLEAESFPCRITLDLGNLSHMMRVVNTVIGSKPGLMMSERERSHLASLILSAHLRTIPLNAAAPSNNTLQYLGIDGLPAHDSYITDGVLFEAPHITTYKTKSIELSYSSNESGRKLACVALFSISLAGDTGESMATRFEVTDSDILEKSVLAQMRDCVERLRQLGVAVVMCQRVIHPNIKKLLRQKGMYAVERLGSQYASAVQQLTGARPLGSFTDGISSANLGVLTSLTHEVICGRSYLHLSRDGSNVCTLVLCNKSAESLAELKHVCEVAADVLKLAVRHPMALSGGGCWQNLLAAQLERQVTSRVSAWSEELGCSKLQLTSAVKIFTRSLRQVIAAIGRPGDHMTDSGHHHHWVAPLHHATKSELPKHCACGMVPRTDHSIFTYIGLEECKFEPETSVNLSECQILDSMPVMVNALTIAIGSAVMVLGIGNIIQDIN